MNVAQLTGTMLARLGAEAAFGVVGSGNFEVTNALRANGVAFTAARHEGGAATMADAWARVSGKLALVSVHQGCGLTNALTGIAEAAKSRTPLLVLAADTASSAVRSNFRVDQGAAVTAVGAIAERVHSAESAPADILRAYTKAVHERRTVVLNLPLDVQAQPVSREAGEITLPVPPLPVRPHPSAVTELAALLAKSERPVFVAGRGALGARGELAELAAKCGALLATSAVANGLFTRDPWSLGISGGFASPLAVELISGADLVVGWGCSLNMWTLRQGSLIGDGAKVAQIDADASALGAHTAVDLGVAGDVALTARDVAAETRQRTGYREPRIARRIAERGRWNTESYVDLSDEGRIDPRTLSIALDDVLPSERIVAVDSGNFMGYPSAYLSVPDEAGFCFTQAFQSIGLGLASAIGAALARPDRLPVAALGDGGALMAAAELETVARLGLPMVLVVYNDAAYGAEVHHFDGGAAGADLGAVRFPDTDFAAVARGYGLSGITVRSAADLGGLRDWLAGPREHAVLVDAKIASDGGSWWLAEAFKGH
ncbi:thiamine pyrophosphate-binding protein [Saccharomonospora sp. NPDC006951]